MTQLHGTLDHSTEWQISTVGGHSTLPAPVEMVYQSANGDMVTWWQFGDVDQIKEVALRQPRLVLGWVAVSGLNNFNSHTREIKLK